MVCRLLSSCGREWAGAGGGAVGGLCFSCGIGLPHLFGLSAPLEMRWGWCLLGILSSCIRGLGAHLELRWGTWFSSQVASGNSELLLICGGNSVFLSICSMGLRVPLELWQGTQGSSRVRGVLRVPLNFWWGLLSSCLEAIHL